MSRNTLNTRHWCSNSTVCTLHSNFIKTVINFKLETLHQLNVDFDFFISYLKFQKQKHVKLRNIFSLILGINIETYWKILISNKYVYTKYSSD